MATEILCIIDKSGSMGPALDDHIGGFNTFLRQQKKLEGGDETAFSLMLFNQDYENIYTGPLADAPELDESNYVPSGMTALFDAVAAGLCLISARVATEYAQGTDVQVIIAILTDGQENMSREIKLPDLTKMIKAAESSNWTFHFLSSDMDSWDDAEAMGLSKSFTSTHGQSVRQTYAKLGTVISINRNQNRNRKPPMGTET
jgi:hypothetical protein